MSAPTAAMTRLWPVAVVVDVQQQRHQATGARHLREQIEERTRSGVDAAAAVRTGRSRIRNAKTSRHRVAAGVAEQLGDQQQGDQPGDEEADRCTGSRRNR